jgi:hypothetical protein
MSQPDNKSLEERVSRLESIVSQAGSRFAVGAIVDPAGPWGGGWGGVYYPPVHGPIGDPAPTDFSRFSAAQLQSALHSIRAEKTRLGAMEELINQQLNQTKKE